MSFGSPWWLLALAILPALVVAYVVVQRRRTAAAGRVVSPALAASVMPRRPGARRHVAPLAVLVALAGLVLAAAKPQRTVAVPVEKATIVLVTDVSGSMRATDVRPSRIAAARSGAQAFVDQVPKSVNISVIAFNQSPDVLEAPTTDRAAIRAALARLQAKGSTATGTAVRAALAQLATQKGADGKQAPGAIVLLSDGASTVGVDPLTAAREAARRKVPITAVALGTAQGTVTTPRADGTGVETRPVPPDPATLREMARISGGKTASVTDAAELKSVYETLGSRLGRRDEQRQITSAFAGGALVVLLLGAASSLRWFGRPL